MPDGAWGSKEPSPLERLVAAREAEKKETGGHDHGPGGPDRIPARADQPG
jgi:hypothetical protein